MVVNTRILYLLPAAANGYVRKKRLSLHEIGCALPGVSSIGIIICRQDLEGAAVVDVPAAQSNIAVNDSEEFAAVNILGFPLTPSDHLLKVQLPKPLTPTAYVRPLVVKKVLVVKPLDTTFPFESYSAV